MPRLAGIAVTGHRATLVMVMPADAEAVLSAGYRAPVANKLGQVVWSQKKESFIEGTPVVDGQMTYVFPSGLVTQVAEQLREMAYDVEIQDGILDENRWVSPRHRKLAIRRSGDVMLVDALVANLAGQLQVTTAQQAAEVIDTALALWPDYRPLIIVKTLPDAVRLERLLMRTIPAVWNTVTHEYPGSKPHTLPILTMHCVAGFPMSKHDLLFLMDWPVLLSKRGRETATLSYMTRHYAITLGPDPQLSQREQMRCLAAAGEVIYDARPVLRSQPD